MLTVKCVVVGDREAGKTCLLSSYTTNRFPSEYAPTVFDTCTVTARVNRKEYALKLYDTSGQEDYHKLRPLNYNETSVFLVCFSVVSPSTVRNVIEKWVPEILRYCRETPFLLVGTQVDLREDSGTLEKLAENNQKVVTFEDGEELARELKAVRYVECSAQTQKGVKVVFEEAVLASLPNKPTYLCVLL